MTELGRGNETEEDVILFLEGCPDTHGEFGLPPGGWSRLLSLAQLYGWRPAGTPAPNEDLLEEDDLSRIGPLSEWDGRYFPGYGQRVTVEDARALGAALKRALPDLPDQEAFERNPRDPAAGDSSSEYLPCPMVDSRTTSFQLYSGKWKEELRSLIDHCLECRGGFWIWSHKGH